MSVFTSCEVEAEPALCAAEVFIAEDTRDGKEVRFDVEECINTRSSLPEKHGDAFIPGPAYLRKCVAARVAARQRAIDLACVVDGFEGNFGRLLRTDVTALNDDRRVPILWINTSTGLRYDCYAAHLTDHDGYCPVLEVDYRYMRDASLFHSGLHHGEQGYEHYWLFPEMLNAENVENAVPAIPIGSFASPNLARIDLGNDVFVAYDRRARDESEELPRAAPVTGCGPVWIPEAASCLTSKGTSESEGRQVAGGHRLWL